MKTYIDSKYFKFDFLSKRSFIFDGKLSIIKMKKLVFTLGTILLLFSNLMAQKEVPLYKKLHYLSEEEMESRDLEQISRDFYPTDPPPAPVRQTAEFERMQSILIRYPFAIPYTMIAEISEDCGVTTLVANQSQENTVINLYQQNGVNLDNCDFIHAPTNSEWTRDYGPWYITKNPSEFGIVNFPYNRPRPDDDDIPIEVANAQGLDLYGMDLIHTGGNYMTDGLGIAASTTLVYTENPDLTEEEIDELVDDYLNIHTYHVLPDPLGDYIEHIDCWGKFLDVDKVLIGQVPESDPRYDDYEYVADYFANQVSSYGNYYQVYRVMTPGNSRTTPYTNSLIVNDKVLVPQTGDNLDDEALDVYEEAMPGYEIVGIFYNNWYNTDAIHCRARGMADLGMLYIKHFPLLGEIPYEDAYQVSATITPYSGEAVVADSVFLYYRVDNNPYSSMVMENTFGFQYRASIPAQELGSDISYYIFAVDESGRQEKHPFIGSADPHVFTIGPPENPDVTTHPDSLIYTEYVQCDTGLIAMVYNNNPVPVTVNYINQEGYDAGFNWYIDPWTIELPYEMGAWDSLALRVKIALPVDYTMGLVTDTLFVGTEIDTHNVYISVEESLVGTESIETSSFSASLHPNPAFEHLGITIKGLKQPGIDISLYDLRGRLMNQFSREISQHDEAIISLDKMIGEIKEGIYFIRISNGPDQLVKKFIKLH